jgi:hypothetical protein
MRVVCACLVPYCKLHSSLTVPRVSAIGEVHVFPYTLTLNLLTTTIVAPPSNASKWQMGFNSAFKGSII